MRTPTDLARAIQIAGIDAALIFPPHETPTVTLAARALHCREDQIIKSVLFLVRREGGEQPVLVISNGTAPIDYRKLAVAWGVSRKSIKLASPETVLATTGYPAGGVPPFGYPRPVETFVDQAVLAQPVVYGGGGDEHTLLRITPKELVRVTGAHVIDAREAGQEPETPVADPGSPRYPE